MRIGHGDLLRDEGTAVVVSIERPEGYERPSTGEVAKEAVRGTWPTRSVPKRGSR